MAVIDLRGSIEGPLARIGGGIGQIITAIKGPDAADRKAFFKNIQDDPDLLNNFGSIARNNPGVLQQMFPFLKDEDIISFRGVLPTLGELKEDILRPALTPEKAGGELPPEIAAAMGEFARAGEVGATPTQLELREKRGVAAEAIPQKAVTAGLRREVTGLTTGQRAQDEFNTEIFNVAMDSFNALGLEEADAAALRDKLPATFFDADNQLAFERRKEIAQMQIDAQNLDRANERTDNFRRGVSARWTERTKVGLPETWQLFLFDREANNRAKELAGGAVPESESDIRLLEVAQAFSRADQVDKGVEEAAVRTQIRAIIDRIGQLDSQGKFKNERTVRQVLAEQLNSAFVELSMLTDNRVPIRIAEIPKSMLEALPFFGPGNKSLVIKDEFGEEIDIGGEGFGEVTREEGARELNFESVDVSQLSPESRNNLAKLMQGASFEDLQRQAPRSAQEILNARRNR